VVVRAQFPGANPRVIAETVAAPLEEQISGIENLLYFESQSTADGAMNLTVTSASAPIPKWPRRRCRTASPRAAAPARYRAPDRRHHRQAGANLTMVVHLLSPDNSHARVLRNYGQLQVRDELLRIDGMAACCCSAPATTRCGSGSIRSSWRRAR